jgi:hypothetical protein
MDTVVATILDPRTKWNARIPNCEILAAVEMIKKACLLFLFQEERERERERERECI